jgi:hypothetical protein
MYTGDRDKIQTCGSAPSPLTCKREFVWALSASQPPPLLESSLYDYGEEQRQKNLDLRLGVEKGIESLEGKMQARHGGSCL